MLEVISKKFRNQMLLCLVLLAATLLIGIIYIASSKPARDVFKGVCEVHNIDDLRKCYETNHHVRIYFDDMYYTNYGLYEDDVLHSYYIDLDIEGYSLIALIKKSEVEALDNGKKYVDGEFSLFENDPENSKILEQIKLDYVEIFSEDTGEEYDLEDIETIIIPFQLDAYHNFEKGSYFVIFGIFIIAIVIFICFAIHGMKLMKSPEKYKLYAIIQNKEQLEYEFKNEVVFRKNNLYLTTNYIIVINFASVIINERKKLVWAYREVTKQYGIITVNKKYICKFLEGLDITISESAVEIFDYMQIPLIGYNNQNIKEYNRLVKEYKELKKTI